MSFEVCQNSEYENTKKKSIEREHSVPLFMRAVLFSTNNIYSYPASCHFFIQRSASSKRGQVKYNTGKTLTLGWGAPKQPGTRVTTKALAPSFELKVKNYRAQQENGCATAFAVACSFSFFATQPCASTLFVLGRSLNYSFDAGVRWVGEKQAEPLIDPDTSKMIG